MKEQDKTSEINLNKTEISNIADKEFKVMVINMLTKLGRRMDGHSKNFNKEIENTIKYPIEVIELKNIVTELKNTLEGFNSRLAEAEERFSHLEDMAV